MRYISRLPDAAWNTARPRSLAVLGSTGSIGRSTLDVIRRQRDRFHVTALAGGGNARLLAEQALEFRPAFLGVLSEEAAAALKALLPKGYAPEILIGQEGYEAIAGLAETGLIVSAQSGAAGLRATAAAARLGKVIALANKESLVMAGSLIRRLCAQSGAVILPVDSEHNAIFQCLTGGGLSGADPIRDMSGGGLSGSGPTLGIPGGGAATEEGVPGLTRLILTASGGPFRDMDRSLLASVTPEQALAHPNWNMGPKITIDSSTLMNKGLEVIEACHLYGLEAKDVEVVVHKESIVHSLAEFADGSQLAHLGLPDMRIAIAHCIGWPDRLTTGVGRLDLAKVGHLSFSAPDEEAFPCLALARRALAEGRGGTVVLNAANEIAVAAFLESRISWPDIAKTVARALDGHSKGPHSLEEPDGLEAILALDAATRLRAEEIVLGLSRSDV